MKRRGRSLMVALMLVGAVSAQNGNEPVQLKDITDGVFNQITSVGEMRSLPDGNFYTAMNKNRTCVLKHAYKTGEVVDTLFNATKARSCDFDAIEGYKLSSNGHHILLWRESEKIYRRSFRAMVYDYDVRRNFVSPITKTKTKVMIPTFSPDGRMCAFVKDNNIWLKKFDYDTEIAVTKDGAVNKIINGSTDWVYEEEFAITNTLSWSPDSKILAFVRFDESKVKTYSMQLYGEGTYPSYYSYKYPNAGEKNAEVSVLAYNIETKDTKTLEVPIKKDSYIPRITFTKESDHLAVMTLNRTQNLLTMYYANPKSGVFRLILHEENKSYVDAEWLNSIHFLSDGFTYVSERDGYAHLYLFSTTGVMRRQVTKGNWDVTAFLGYDEKNQVAYYESAEESPLRRSVYSIDHKGRKEKLSTQVGTNSATFNSDYTYYLNTFSSALEPARISLFETKNNKEVRILRDNQALRGVLAQHRFSNREFTTVKTASGYELNAWMVKPINFDPNKKYPVLMTQYSGPNSQSALDSYSFGWEHYLASRGILVVCVDGRGTGARGEAFRKCTYLRMGEKESLDQVEAAQALAKLPYVDGKRMSIWGWSFGGYNTLMALTVGKGTFKVGIAVAPPSDWRFYDTVYTERFMRTPQENQKGYDITSPLKRVNEMQGKLLLVHGTADDNVHFIQTMRYAEALTQAGKQFDMQIYKDRNHSISGGNTRYHLYTRLANFLFDNL